MTSFSTGERKSTKRKDRRSTEISYVIKQTFESVILTELFPKTQIDIFMKVLLLVAGSRAGLEFFLSLLDGHTEILQLPGFIRGNKKLIQILSYDDCSEISSNFIKTSSFNLK